MRILFLAWVILVLLAPPGSGADTRIVASTGVVTVLEKISTPHNLLDLTEYSTRVASQRDAVAAIALPGDLPANARYALVRDAERQATAVTWTADDGTRYLVVDRDADGDLSTETPVPMTPEGKRFVARIPAGDGLAPGRFDLLPGERDRLFQFIMLERRGVMTVGGREIAFIVQGSASGFGGEHDAVYFDLDGDGQLKTWDRTSFEHYSGADRHVNIDGTSYSFEVAGDGSTLTLTPLPELLPERPRVDRGVPAPDFGFTTVDGKSGRLGDYRGQAVLLFTWGSWCEPCRADMPAVERAYAEYRDRGFEILAFNVNDSDDTVADYARRQGWLHITHASGEWIRDLYRMRGTPDYVLIDPEGTIADHSVRGSTLADKLGNMLMKASSEVATSP